ncbi:MAG: sigma-70 family RNA polymerase sigma factor [Bacteroidaceae bacterium]|jgi:RNA polymerase sigma-70 factor (ECF subfamily)|nr:sigma-70 family RNA polymerase sigma factor [Bacteroidaceae bacterium]
MTPEVLTESFKSLSDGLYRVAYYMLESQADAEDAVQDLFIKLWGNRDQLDTVLNFKAYCTTLMKNLCIDRLRKEQRVQSMEPGPDVAESRLVDEDYDAREKLERVLAAIERLPGRQRDVMKMYVLEEMSYEEIAEKTGMSNLTLRVLLSNARKSLRSQI